MRTSLLVAVALPAWCALSNAQTTLTWDGGMTNSPAGGSGTWDAATTADWYNGTTDQIWANGGAAIFGGTAGTVTLASSGAANSATEVDANSITINTAGYTFGGNYLRMTGANPTITANVDTTFNAAVYTSVGGMTNIGFIKAGSGTLTLAGTGIAGTAQAGDTRFGGLIQVTGGTLALGNGATGSKGGYFDNSAFALSNGANVSFNYDTLTSDPNPVSNISGTGNIALLGMKNGYYSVSSGFKFTNTGATTINLTAGGAQTYFDTVFLQNANVLSPTSTLNILSGNVEMRGAQTVLGLTNTGTANTGTTNTGGFITGAQTLTLTPAAGQTYTYGGTIGLGQANGNEGSAAVVLTLNGPGTQILTGVNTFTGATTISQGTLQLGNGTGNTGSLSATSGISVASGATLAVNYNAVTTGNGTPSALPVTGAGNYSLLGNQGGFYSSGGSGGPATLAITGTTNVNLIPNSTSPFFGSLFVQSANVLSPNSVLNVISGNVDLRGNQTVLGLTNTGTPIAGTTNTGGAITTDGTRTGAAIPILTVTPATGTTYTYGGLIGLPATNGGVAGAGADTYHSTTVGLTMNGAGTQILNGVTNYSGPTTISQGTLQFGDGTGSTGNGLTSAITVAAGANLIFNNNNNTNINAAISGAGNISFLGEAAGFAGLNTALTNTGTLNVALLPASGFPAFPSGTLFVNGNNILSANSVLNVTSGVVDLRQAATNSNDTIAGLTGTGGAVTTDGGRTANLTIAPAAGTSYQYSGVVGIPNASYGPAATTVLSLTLDGPGTQILTGANTYSGTTTVGATVSGGTLLINGTNSGTGAVTVGTSGGAVTGTLGGTGTITGAVTINAGSRLAPGTLGTAGTLHTGALTLANSAVFNADLLNTTTFDRLISSGAVNLSGSTLNLNLLSGGTFANNSVLNLIQGTSLTGAFANAPAGTVFTLGGYNFTADYATTINGFDLDVSLAAVPEPATWLGSLLLVGTLGIALRRKMVVRRAPSAA